MDRKEKQRSVLAVCIIAAVTAYTLSYIVFKPGEILLTTGGDGVKNYYTFLYHSLYGSGVWFDGMNYPYGEHIVFTDAQPVFSVALSYINKLLPINPLIVFHLFIVAGFMTGIWYLYKIFRRFALPYQWSVFFACLIVVMSPQELKLSGHFALAYICVLPMVFYYNLAWLQEHKSKHLWKLFFTALVFTFVHPYFALMTCLWVAIYSFGYVVLFKSRIGDKIRHIIPVLLAAVTPMVVLKVFMLLTDNLTDRPEYPYGARWNRTFNNDLYTSYLSPFSQWLQKQVDVGSLSGGNEGYTYIGLAPIFILLVAVVLYCSKIIRDRKLKMQTDDSKDSIFIWMIVGAGMLLFASSFIFVRCFVCLDYASFIRQFRAVGRFAWGYYYIATVVSVVLLYRWYLYFIARNHKIIASVMVMILSAVWIVEAIPFADMVRGYAKAGKENYAQFYNTKTQTWESFLQQNGLDKNNFQSILVLPYIHVGTEKLGVNSGKEGILTNAFSASLELGLPIMDVTMSRSSWSQAFAQVRTVGGEFTDKPCIQNRNPKPILLLHAESIYKANPEELHLVSCATKVGTFKEYNVYALYSDTLRAIEQSLRSNILNVFDDMTANDTCIKYSGIWHVEHYDNGFAAEKLFGTGAEKAIEGNTEIIFRAPLTPAYDGQLYEFSAWTLVSNKDYKIGRFRVLGYDKNNQVVSESKLYVQESVDNEGLWLRAHVYFPLPATCDRVIVELINIINPAYLALDELMIRPADALILSKMPDGTGMVNNHVLKR